VLVPTSGAAPRPRAEFQLSCPRGFIAAGLDAELTSREIDLAFDGFVGAPVSPGIATQQAVVFTATYVGAGASVASFRPHLGCVPANGGGGRLPTAYHAIPIFPPAHVTVRHTKDVRVHTGANRIVQACAGGERLVRAWNARAFTSAGPPSAALAAGLSLTASVAGGHALVLAHARAPSAGAGALVQIGVVCVGGR
jgi:hypothetical protein